MEATPAGPHHLLLVKRAGKKGALQPSDYNEWTVIELDGAVKFALRTPKTGSNSCKVLGESIQEGYYVLTLQRLGTPKDALLFGHISDPRPRVAFYDDASDDTPGWGVGSGWIIRALGLSGYLAMYSHDFSVMKEVESPFPVGGIPRVFGKDVLWDNGDLLIGPIGAYDDVRGFHVLVQPEKPSDYTSGIGSDGKDMVWTLGEGRKDGEYTWPVRSVITAPYTTDPIAVHARRLRSDPGVIVGPDDWSVGCGYGGRRILGTSGVQLVRLSDGVAWHLTSEKKSGIFWDQVMGFTCEEAFVRIERVSGANVVRIRLDSLGPGLPPD